jgi:hypothetical protein
MAGLPVSPPARNAWLLVRRGDRHDLHGRPAHLAAVAAAAADRAGRADCCVSSFPLAHLFEASGNTIWGPALLHCVITVFTASTSTSAISWFEAPRAIN